MILFYHIWLKTVWIGRKKAPALAKVTGEINQNIGEQITMIYIWKIAFSQPGERFVRRESSQAIRTSRPGCLVWSSDEDKLRYTVDYFPDKDNL